MGLNNLEKPTKDFQIAILIEDIRDAKALSDGLREIGIFAHYYQDLDELWVSLNSYTPDFCIIDVKKMSAGTLLFKHHPKVRNNDLKYSFYYKDSSKILLRSTYGLNHYGYVRAELDLVDQLKCVLRRRNEELRLKEQSQNMEARVERLRVRGRRLAELQEKNAFAQKQDEKLSDLMRSFGIVESRHDFKRRMVTFFDQWDDCLEFGIYELNMTGQKLTAPQFNKAKYRVLPDLWLAKVSEQGINNFAQDMAYDVAYGLMNEKIMTLKIQGAHQDPDFIVLLNLNQAAVRGFNWDLLGMKLSSEYRRACLRDELEPVVEDHSSDVFEMMQTMDDINFNQAQTKYRHILVDFSSLKDFIKQRPTNRFFWKTFARDVRTEISNMLSGDFKISYFGAAHFIVAVEKRFVDGDYAKLKQYIGDFEYWRYFEDSSLVVSTDVIPSIRFVAPSSVNLIRQVEEAQQDFMQELVNNDLQKPGLRQIEV